MTKQEKKAYRKLLNEPPKRLLIEEIFNAISHGIGALLAICALVIMLINSDTPLKIMASLFYGISLIFMMLMSTLYHSFRSGSTVKRLWRRFDYSSIYLLIGGTFAPLFLIYYGNTLGIILFVIQWALIITGITMVAIFGPGPIKWLNFPLFFLIGWSGVMFIPDWINNNLNLLWWILGGGIIYSLGMIPFCLNRIKWMHFIWHLFVLAGAIVQFMGIFINLY